MLRPGGRMVHRLPGSIEPALEGGAVLAQIVQDAGKSGCPPSAKLTAALRRQSSHSHEMVRQQLPIGPVFALGRMREEHARHPIASTFAEKTGQRQCLRVNPRAYPGISGRPAQVSVKASPTCKPECASVANMAIAGGILMELALLGRIDTDLKSLFIVDPTPVGDELLDHALQKIAAEPQKQSKQGGFA